ncbi:MCP four helix bundle domain-containing protein [Arcticibacter sp. MXS-1]|uniref:MCP four helix bundle domain-containing protein n=1 Tax=Arcticibacter sp. MXS-1 TaxID=3341726 RepID=UPI0035A9067A
MRWTFVIQQKVKVACVLFSIMLLIMLFSFLEKRNISQVNESATSIYKDRLVPATDIFYLSEHLHGKRFLMEHLLRPEARETARAGQQLQAHNRSVDQLIQKFEKTYLVEDESRYLAQLKSEVEAYNRLEARILHLIAQGDQAGASSLYQAKGRASLEQTTRKLALLARVQTTVAGELIKSSEGTVASASLISSLQIVLAIITGLIVLSLVFASRITVDKGHGYRWN